MTEQRSHDRQLAIDALALQHATDEKLRRVQKLSRWRNFLTGLAIGTLITALFIIPPIKEYQAFLVLAYLVASIVLYFFE